MFGGGEIVVASKFVNIPLKLGVLKCFHDVELIPGSFPLLKCVRPYKC